MNIVKHNVVKACGVDDSAAVLIRRRLSVTEHDLCAVGIHADAYNIIRVNVSQLRFITFEDSV